MLLDQCWVVMVNKLGLGLKVAAQSRHWPTYKPEVHAAEC